jgi:hypothetical protein
MTAGWVLIKIIYQERTVFNAVFDFQKVIQFSINFFNCQYHLVVVIEK